LSHKAATTKPAHRSRLKERALEESADGFGEELINPSAEKERR
jgi:hypothetical protein